LPDSGLFTHTGRAGKGGGGDATEISGAQLVFLVILIFPVSFEKVPFQKQALVWHKSFGWRFEISQPKEGGICAIKVKTKQGHGWMVVEGGGGASTGTLISRGGPRSRRGTAWTIWPSTTHYIVVVAHGSCF
jgi:hypothetical protein